MAVGQRQDAHLRIEDGFWKLRRREGATDASGSVERHRLRPVWIGPAAGPERPADEQVEQIASGDFPSRQDQVTHMPLSTMTITDFVAKAFVPEHVATKGLAGRAHYHAILKHVLRPEEVDRVFQAQEKRKTRKGDRQASAEKPKSRLKTVADWPYLGKVRLCDALPDDVQRLISAALARGYSTQTAIHIRNVVSAIFAYARQKQWFTGDNPAARVTLPEMIRKEAHALTLAQAEEVLEVMQYPEKEMALISIFTGLNMGEICGLQWKYVNLTEAWSNAEGESLPPGTLAVRRQWHRGKLGDVEQKIRHRNLPISEPVRTILLSLSQRAKWTGPDDFVLVSQTGTPINQNNVMARRLKLIGNDLQMPWLSWRVFQRTHTTLAQELGMRALGDHVAKARDEKVSLPVDGPESKSMASGA